jgi:hypothetical protein
MQKEKKMKDENKKSTKESFEQIDAEKNVSRRNFIRGQRVRSLQAQRSA